MAKVKKAPDRLTSTTRIVRGVAYALMLAFFGLLGTVGGYVARSKNVREALTQSIRRTPPQDIFGRNGLTVLILGCDVDIDPRTHKKLLSEARSDMMMLASLDFKNRSIRGLSLARDIYHKIPREKTGHKLNAFVKYGGPAHSKKAVESLLGVSIDRVVMVDYDAFQQLVEIVGGVDVDVDKALKYTDKAGGLYIDIKPGHQKLDGYNAMCFVRYRHGDNDFARQARQQQFLLSLKRQIVTHPQTLEPVAEMAQKVLGNEFSTEEAVSLALFAETVPASQIKLGQVAIVEKKGTTALGLNRTETRKILREYGILAVGPMDPQETPPRHRRKKRLGG